MERRQNTLCGRGDSGSTATSINCNGKVMEKTDDGLGVWMGARDKDKTRFSYSDLIQECELRSYFFCCIHSSTDPMGFHSELDIDI